MVRLSSGFFAAASALAEKREELKIKCGNPVEVIKSWPKRNKQYGAYVPED